MIHPLIALFETKAAVIEITDGKDGLDEAIALLASWMSVAENKLSEDDLAVLSDVGAILYKEGLRRRSE
jgi:hypothetical protein